MGASNVIADWQSISHETTRLLRPIEGEAQYKKVMAVVRELWDLAETDPGLETLLELLTERVQAYEDRRFPTPDPAPAEALQFLMEQRGLTQEELAEELGLHQSTLSRLLSGSRLPTAKQVSALAAYFKVDPSLFLEAA